MDVNKVIENTKYLNPKERAFVAHCLICSLDTKHDDGVDLAWAELAEERYGELVSGEVEAVSWEQIRKDIKV